MRVVRYYDRVDRVGHIYTVKCSECGDLAERFIEKEAEELCLEHEFAHITGAILTPL